MKIAIVYFNEILVMEKLCDICINKISEGTSQVVSVTRENMKTKIFSLSLL